MNRQAGLKNKADDNQSKIQELFSRVDSVEEHFEKLDQMTVHLNNTKCTKDTFFTNLTRIDTLLSKLEEIVYST